jgi:hypothetical protein
VLSGIVRHPEQARADEDGGDEGAADQERPEAAGEEFAA